MFSLLYKCIFIVFFVFVCNDFCYVVGIGIVFMFNNDIFVVFSMTFRIYCDASMIFLYFFLDNLLGDFSVGFGVLIFNIILFYFFVILYVFVYVNVLLLFENDVVAFVNCLFNVRRYF